jgi:hypothetical protein
MNPSSSFTIENIIQSLTLKINEIEQNNKIPVVFILIGTYPGFSNIHQTPPYISELIKDDRISPIVLLFDPYYNHSKVSLLFLNHHDMTNEIVNNPQQKQHPEMGLDFPEEGVWYNPHYIPALKSSYEGKVSYQYYSNNVSDEYFRIIMVQFIKNKHLIFYWNFTGHDIIDYFTKVIKNKHYPNIHINKADCSADVYYDIDYYPEIKYNDDENKYILVNQSIEFTDYVNDISQILKKIKDVKEPVDLVLKDKLYGSFYILFEKWLADFKTYRSWEIQIRNDDPSKIITFTKDSTKDEWRHLSYRVGVYFDTTKFINGFMKSKEYLLSEYINNQIYQMGEIIIELESLSATSDELNFVQSLFIEQHFNLIRENSKKIPMLFECFIQKYCNKYNRTLTIN